MNGLIHVICTKTSWKLDTIDIVNTGNSCTQIVWGNTSQCNKLETNIVSSWDMTVIYQINSSNSHRDVVSFVCNHTLWSQFKNNEHKINKSTYTYSKFHQLITAPFYTSAVHFSLHALKHISTGKFVECWGFYHWNGVDLLTEFHPAMEECSKSIPNQQIFDIDGFCTQQYLSSLKFICVERANRMQFE